MGVREQAKRSLPAAVAGLRLASRVFRNPISVLVFAVVALGLGFWGFSKLDGASTDEAYRTAQLIYLNASVPDEGTPWQLDIARFLAPLILPYAALVALISTVGERAGRLRMSLFGRNHILVVGGGSRGTALMRSLRDANDVVLFEIDEANGAALSLRRSGITVLFGDARDDRALKAAHPERAASIVLLAGDDSVNLDILATLRKLTDPERQDGAEQRKHVPVHVAIDGILLWAGLHRLPLEDEDAQRRVEFFSIPDRAARLIASRAFVAGERRDRDRRILIRGAGEVVSRLVVQLLRTTEVGGSPAFFLEGPDAEESLETLRTTDPWVFDRASISVAGDLGEITDSFVCGLPEGDALAAAAALVQRLPGESRIHVSVPDADTEETLNEVGVDLQRYVLIPTDVEVISEALLGLSSFELIARGRHNAYLDGEQGEGRQTGITDAHRDWEQLPEHHKIANYRYADGVYRMLDDLGARLVPLEIDASRVEDLQLSKTAMEYMCVREHNRWWDDKCQDGFVWGADKVEGTKVHNAMVPWSWLPQADVDRDVESVRILPKLLAECGYAIEMPPSDEVDARIEAAGGTEAAASWEPVDERCKPPKDRRPPAFDRPPAIDG